MMDVVYGDSAHRPGIDADDVARRVANVAGARVKELRGGGWKIVCKDVDAATIVAMLQEEGIQAAAIQSYESM
jgi:hypothetical protein